MANNQLIQGAKLTGKKFLDVGAAVGEGLMSAGGFGNYTNPRVARNKAIQSRVNTYMGKMKTDMDFTSFSPSETSTMRSYLVGQRDKYAEAARGAASFSDTSDPGYSEYVDIMNGVNNSFTNLAKQLESYKTGKVTYAKGQLDGIYSDGTDEEVGTDTAAMYGFWDHDEDSSTAKEGGADAAFQILDGGNLGFNINGREITYNDSPPLIIKDYQLATSIINDNEAAYKSGKPANENSLKAYRLQLEQKLSSQDAVKSMIFDFNDELGTTDLQDAITSGAMNVPQAKEEFINRMVNSRRQVSQQGYNEQVARSQSNYNRKEAQRIARLEATAEIKGKGKAKGNDVYSIDPAVQEKAVKNLTKELSREPTEEELARYLLKMNEGIRLN